MGCASSSAKTKGNNEMIVDESHFEPLRIIGKGASGTIHAVIHKATGRIMALKKFPKELLCVDSHLLAAVEQEKNIHLYLQNLNSPFLLTLEFSFSNDTDLIMITPFEIGGDLETSLWRRKVRFLPEGDLKFYGSEMLLALEALHSDNIIHMDVKPSNVLIGADGHTKMCDMGMSFVLQDGEAGKICHKLLGTPGFEAPEVHKQDLCGTGCDIFSLGVTWYALVLARLPFGSEPDYDNLRKLIFVPRKASKRFFPLSAPLIDLLTKMLTYDWRKRITIPEIKKHPFFNGFDWNAAAQRRNPPSFIPDPEDWKKNDEFAEDDEKAKQAAKIDRRGSIGVVSKELAARFNQWSSPSVVLVESTSHPKSNMAFVQSGVDATAAEKEKAMHDEADAQAAAFRSKNGGNMNRRGSLPASVKLGRRGSLPSAADIAKLRASLTSQSKVIMGSTLKK